MMLNNNFDDVLKQEVFQTLIRCVADLDLETYLVGGFVRDHLLGRGKAKDIDIVAVGSGIDLAKVVQQELPGANAIQIFKNYGTAMVQWRDITLEFVGARKESYSEESRNPIVKKGTLKDDQHRRDFTINALAVSLNPGEVGKLVDPFQGLNDLQEGVIKTPLDPDVTYSDDPLRMLRAIRFAAQLNFKIEDESRRSISKNRQRIDIISKERVVEELHKIMMCSKPSLGFLLLEQNGLLECIIPELIKLKGIEEIEGQKHKDNFYHTLEVVDNICENTDNLWLRWAALLHDIGKAPTKKFHPKIGWTFHAHEFIGSKMVYKLFKRLKMPLNEKMKYVQKLVMMSSRPIIIAEDIVTDAAVRRLVFDAGEILDDLITLCEADITTKNPARFNQYHNNFKIVRAKIKEVEERDRIRNFQPPVTGEMIMEFFNLRPCKEIGLIKEAIKEAILEGEIPNEYNAAFKLMIKKGGEIGLQPNEK
ncbi:MAG: CCA tRNA nucleotidyltransferase [Flavobacteriaceae bacterium]|jgi:tRNA nucleotidyltransferase (CCA-adding enzyme)|nr:CCA tRNA nucleotidyltransferase [Flavobacteriaceae bacterium]